MYIIYFCLYNNINNIINDLFIIIFSPDEWTLLLHNVLSLFRGFYIKQMLSDVILVISAQFWLSFAIYIYGSLIGLL